MAEVEKLIVAKFYCEKLANGIDPISDKPVPSDSVLNQVKLVRFFFFLKEYLNEELQGSSSKASSKQRNQSFLITREGLSEVEVSSNPISISEFAKRVNQKTKPTSKLFICRWATDWLIQARLLAVSMVDGKKYPTEAGKRIGISLEARTRRSQEYQVVIYNETAQQFLLDNMDAILEPQGYCVIQ